MKIRHLQLLIVLMICFSVLLPMKTAAEAESIFNIDARSLILMDRDSGEVIYEQNMHKKLPPASMTKIMTLLLISEAIAKGQLTMDEMITTSETAAGMGGSQVFLEVGEEMSVEDLVKAIAIASANDASVALAERIAGSETAFVQLMNERAKELGLENTLFQNASGLPADNHFSTAYDMAIIAKALLQHESIVEYTSIYEDYLRKGTDKEFWLVNTNKLVRHFPYVDGLKTGYTSEAKFCLTATALKDDMRVISVVIGANSSKERNALTMQLIDYAFNNYESTEIVRQDEVVTQFKNMYTEKLIYDVKTEDKLTVLQKKGAAEELEYEIDIVMDKENQLPLKKGQSIGKMIVKLPNNELETNLIVDEDVEQASYFTIVKRLLKQMAEIV